MDDNWGYPHDSGNHHKVNLGDGYGKGMEKTIALHWRLKQLISGLGIDVSFWGLVSHHRNSHICWRWHIPNSWLMFKKGTFTKPCGLWVEMSLQALPSWTKRADAASLARQMREVKVCNFRTKWNWESPAKMVTPKLYIYISRKTICFPCISLPLNVIPNKQSKIEI